MRNEFGLLDAALREKGRLVTAVIVRTAGSTPRKAGTRMAVFADGSSLGTIGGGSFEDTVTRDARSFFESKGNALRHYAFHPDETGRGSAICGGEADVFYEYYESAPRLLVFGAGHCGKALLRAAALVGYRLRVADDRAELLDEVRSWNEPAVEECIPLDPSLDPLPDFDAGTAVVIMTRNHEFDEEILKRVIRNPFAYLGMIASKSKAKTIRDHLLAEGFTPGEVERVHMPIGIPIHSETPEEIAVSILGELIAVRNA